jgi:hypothetical protein
LSAWSSSLARVQSFLGGGVIILYLDDVLSMVAI